MRYELYIHPRLGKHCRRIRDNLDERKIGYEELDITSKIGFKKFRQLTDVLGDFLYRKNEKGENRMDFPILIKRTPQEIRIIGQGDKITKILL